MEFTIYIDEYIGELIVEDYLVLSGLDEARTRRPRVCTVWAMEFILFFTFRLNQRVVGNFFSSRLISYRLYCQSGQRNQAIEI